MGSATGEEVVAAPAPVSLWRNRSFNLLWTSQSLSDLGSSIAALAIPLLVLAKTGSPVQAGVVGTVIMVVRLLAQLPSGVLADRIDRRRAMLLCDLVRLAAYLVLAVTVLRGSFNLPLLIAVVVVDAGSAVLFSTSEHAALRTIVPQSQLPAAVARNEARAYGTSLAGPSLGGVLFGLGQSFPFFGNVVSYLVSLGAILFIRSPMQGEREPAAERSHAADLVEGVTFVLRNPFLRALLFIAAPLNLGFNGALFALILLLQRHGTAPALIGGAEAIFGFGGLLGALAAPAVQRLLRLRSLVVAICWLATGLIAVAALLTGSVAAAVPLAAAVFLGPACNASLFGYQAAITPDRLQGRVISVLFLVSMSLSAVAPVLAGLLVAHFAGWVPMIVFAAIVGSSAVAATVSAGMRAVRPLSEVAATAA